MRSPDERARKGRSCTSEFHLGSDNMLFGASGTHAVPVVVWRASREAAGSLYGSSGIKLPSDMYSRALFLTLAACNRYYIFRPRTHLVALHLTLSRVVWFTRQKRCSSDQCCEKPASVASLTVNTTRKYHDPQPSLVLRKGSVRLELASRGSQHRSKTHATPPVRRCN